jgi:hypothetical protein
VVLCAADAREGEQVLDQALHSPRPLDHEAHELARLAVEAVRVAALEQLGEADTIRNGSCRSCEAT